ncbi:hypothetical protein SteCoe_34961 [Stentor coeruleus]|uniref:Uncharacterized protein n=1 Tax=Stentor coeruleus TaxID=5963 RepID=A0A1R2ATE0_9CILI|nr:hypothetical protein SteCoe_34961 [Stentor coeruleus]
MDFQNRLSNTPIYDQESLDEIYKGFTPGSGSQDSTPMLTPLTSKRDTNIRSFQTKYLSKRHRFFKVTVKEDCIEEALTAVERRLKGLVERYNGDLHVCKVSGLSDITAYFIVNDEYNNASWARELEDSLSSFIKPGCKPSILEMANFKPS